MPREQEECYICGRPLEDSDDSGRCEGCLDELQEQGEGWDN